MAKKRKKPGPPPPPVRRAAPRPRPAPGEQTPKQAARAAAAKQQRADKARRGLSALAALLVLAGLVGAYVWYQDREEAQLEAYLTSGSCTTDEESDPTLPAGQNHVPNPQYVVNPPAGGDHLPSTAPAGTYAGEQVPADGQLVHSLEHGYVILWHDEEASEEERNELAEVADAHPEDVIVAERPGMESAFAATAWGERILCTELEAQQLDRFVDEHVGNGPEDVPRG